MRLRTVTRKLALYILRYDLRHVSPGFSLAMRTVYLLVALVLLIRIAVGGFPRALDCSTAAQHDSQTSAQASGDTSWVWQIVAWWAAAVIVSAFVAGRIWGKAKKLALQRRINPQRRIEGFVTLTAGSTVLATLVLVAITELIYHGTCENALPVWLANVAPATAYFSVILIGVGAVWVNDIAWIGIAYVAVADFCMSLCFLGVLLFAPLDAQGRGDNQLFLAAFLVHFICTWIAARWSYSVARIAAAIPVDRAKASEAGRSLAALWIILAAGTVQQRLFPTTAQDGLFDTLRAPILVALTLGALIATMGGAFTKYVEGRDSARERQLVQANAPGTRDRQIVGVCARMLAAVGPLDFATLVAGVRRVLATEVNERDVIKAIKKTRRVIRCSADEYRLADVGGRGSLWPTDSVFLSLVEKSHKSTFTRREIGRLLGKSKTQNALRPDYYINIHPLLRTTKEWGGQKPRAWRTRWTVVTRAPEEQRDDDVASTLESKR